MGSILTKCSSTDTEELLNVAGNMTANDVQEKHDEWIFTPKREVRKVPRIKLSFVA